MTPMTSFDVTNSPIASLTKVPPPTTTPKPGRGDSLLSLLGSYERVSSLISLDFHQLISDLTLF